jgi:hypothetical protein
VLRLVLLLILGACTGSPVPEPPNLAPPALDRVSSMPSSSGSSILTGAAGAAEPGTFLWAANLETADAPVTTPVAADGSFMLSVSFRDGDELRLQVRDTEDGRSRPVDVTTPDIAEVVRPLAGCLTIEPPLELDFGTTPTGTPVTETLAIDNACGDTVTIAMVRSRSGSTSFATATTTPIDVADGASASIEVSFVPATVGTQEEILFLEVSVPSTERRPITVIGNAR